MKTEHILAASIIMLAVGCDASGAPVAKDKSAELRPARAPIVETEKNIDIQGAGATFPYPLYSKWISEFQKVDPRVRINYQSIGSGGGIRQITEGTIDFGASDATMSDQELAKAPSKLLHIPMTLGAVVVTYNLPEIPALRLSPEIAASIFLGEIKKWNDKRIAALNPNTKLPDKPITVVFRSDGSGTTAIFTQYLSKMSVVWKEKVGTGKSVKFPVGLGAKGNEGVAGQIKTSRNSIGYVELAYAKQTGLPRASIKNQNGNFVDPALESITAAAAGAANAIPDDMRLSIVDAPGSSAYPIAAFTYILVYEEQRDAVKGKALARFLWWAIHDGQAFGSPLDYAPLPAEVVTKIEVKLRTLRADGKPLLATR